MWPFSISQNFSETALCHYSPRLEHPFGLLVTRLSKWAQTLCSNNYWSFTKKIKCLTNETFMFRWPILPVVGIFRQTRWWQGNISLTCTLWAYEPWFKFRIVLSIRFCRASWKLDSLIVPACALWAMMSTHSSSFAERTLSSTASAPSLLLDAWPSALAAYSWRTFCRTTMNPVEKIPVGVSWLVKQLQLQAVQISLSGWKLNRFWNRSGLHH